ncbi:BTAD domain-containing putative transcriptional regulator [Dactylosporangium sp. AC04546]|uniref:BTAD domain-containing putative transcriptional regulator n=1 Tax=Dactylosporangium sp. AC04546 TaxID=2862460 RepID=UPI001EE07D97|nr:BTAD domain-containing putative transcriptional regulator [Dactylosporangium sp. AC04546]WVK87611.1 BTAD domain-containing putative transcriptional regulator [Dactylosporangium sp. AC04546]
MELSVSVLGDMTATVRGEPVDLGGRRQRAVLAVLVLNRGDIVPTDRLVDCVWADHPPANAAGALQAYVSHLRRRLEPGGTARARGNIIVSRPPGYALTLPPDAVDAWRFERLIQTALQDDEAAQRDLLPQALRLWQGPAYAEYADEPWAQPEAARLAELREVAREQLLSARLALGESAVLVPELEALVAEEPLREKRWRLLVLALYRAHRQGDALAALRRARQTLSEQLGVDPGPALRALEAEVLAQAPSLDPAPVVVTPPAPTAEAAPAAPAPPAPPAPTTVVEERRGDVLVDREREVFELRQAAADAFDGLARFAVIEGPAGIGKSRLLTEARRIAEEHGALVLTARGSQLEKEFGFGAARQLFEALLTQPAERERLLSGAAASAGSVFDLGGAEPPRGDHTFAVLHGLYWLTANAASARSLAIVVDDLQWCDTGSLRFLAYLVRRLEGLPVLVVATLRTGEQYDDDALLAELQLDPATVAVRPGPLSPDGVADLVRERLGSTAESRFIAACHRTTSGNPLLLRQLLKALEANGVRPSAAHVGTVTAIGSRAVSSMVLIRLRRMPAASTAVARAIAVLGDGVGLPTIAALAGVDEPEAAAAVAALARAEVVRHEYPIGFVHPLVRDAVYQDLPPGERQLQHERAAQVLHGKSAAPEQIAAHLLQIPERADPWVVEVLRAAAETALNRGAPDGAATYLSRALAEPPPAAQRPAVLLHLGQVETLNDGPAAIAHLRAAYDDPITDPATFAAVARMLIHTLIFAGPEGNAPEFARQASARLAAEFVDERLGMLALERIAAYMYSGDAFAAGDFTAEITGGGLGARMLSACRAWELVARGIDRTEAVRLARFALAEGILLRGDPGLFWVIAGVVLENADADAGGLWDDALALGHTRGSLFTVLAAQLWLGWRLWQRGDLPEARHNLLAANDQNLRWGGVPALGISYGEAYLVRVLIDRGDLAGARAFVDAHETRIRIGDGIRLFAQAKVDLLMAEGRPADALVVLDTELTTDYLANPMWFEERSLRARALAALGRLDEAVALAEDDIARLRDWGAPRAVGRGLRLLGTLRRDPDLLREAVALLAGTEARLEYTRALYGLGQVVDEPVEQYREALKLAEECGATPLRAEIAAALAALGDQVPAEPPAALTTGERRLVTMHVGGADDREIAQALFLTPHTVRDTLDTIRRRFGVADLAEV